VLSDEVKAEVVRKANELIETHLTAKDAQSPRNLKSNYITGLTAK